MTSKMARQMRVRGDSLSDVVRRAGRRLPRRYRKDAAVLVDAELKLGHPKLARHIDEAGFTRAERRLDDYLNSRDPVAARWGAVLDRIAAVAFVVLTIVLAVFFYLLWQGRLT